jgi:hypothetical protein
MSVLIVDFVARLSLAVGLVRIGRYLEAPRRSETAVGHMSKAIDAFAVAGLAVACAWWLGD